jgi:ribosomal protein S18 acetylase RimI-like enzyme
MNIKVLTRKEEIYAYLKRNAPLQIYCIGDLDDFFFPYTTWYGLSDQGLIRSLALLYSAMEVPTLLLFHEGSDTYSSQLLHLLKPLLPTRFYAHLSPGLTEVLGTGNIAEHYGVNYKMTLKKLPPAIHDNGIRQLTIHDMEAVTEFYSQAYPHNWFDRRMLETEKYFGYFEGNTLGGVAGVHVYSAQYRVAALGNIAVHPDMRGRQTGFRLTSVLCNDLVQTTDTIGLNVRSDNQAAISLYQKAGFEITARYEECYFVMDRVLHL